VLIDAGSLDPISELNIAHELEQGASYLHFTDGQGTLGTVAVTDATVWKVQLHKFSQETMELVKHGHFEIRNAVERSVTSQLPISAAATCPRFQSCSLLTTTTNGTLCVGAMKPSNCVLNSQHPHPEGCVGSRKPSQPATSTPPQAANTRPNLDYVLDRF
jgi:hypothetical protein